MQIHAIVLPMNDTTRTIGGDAQAAATSFDRLWESLVDIGRDPVTGGYDRIPWGEADLSCRDWFERQTASRGLAYECDRNGNQWGWWGDPSAAEAVVTGSHLDSVPQGGAYDGALGVVSAFAAVDLLRERGARPKRPIAVVSFVEEEGGRFGYACVGSRLMTGALDPDRARTLVDADGLTLRDAFRQAGCDPDNLGADLERLRRIHAFVEVHIEQGRSLVHVDAAIGIASEIWPHGRFRFDFRGEANHAGTTHLADRKDPTLAFAQATLAARDAAARHAGFATFGRLRLEPNATNAIPSLLQAWLDARAPEEEWVRAIVADTAAVAAVDPETEVWAPGVVFDEKLRSLLLERLGAPMLPSAAGHDAAVLASAGVPTAMIFVRNETGVSHSPTEHAERADCLAGIHALATVFENLACR